MLIKIDVAGLCFTAHMESEKALATCKAFAVQLPFRSKLIQCRWSGESDWIPLGDFRWGVGYENHTSHPWPGQILFYPGGISEAEILIPYGACSFSSRVGQLAGNHFMTITEGIEQLPVLGEKVLWEGAQDISFTEIKA